MIYSLGLSICHLTSWDYLSKEEGQWLGLPCGQQLSFSGKEKSCITFKDHHTSFANIRNGVFYVLCIDLKIFYVTFTLRQFFLLRYY